MRKVLRVLLILVAALCIGYFGFYSYTYYRTGEDSYRLALIRERQSAMPTAKEITVEVESEEAKGEPRTFIVLDEYKNLYNMNRDLVGWLKIADTKIDYPVTQYINNTYYLDKNFHEETDKNGTLFLDKDCSIYDPSTNLIIYGHNMKSGEMFGKLENYKKKSYFEKHPVIEFDTIYEKSQYQVMYAFLGRVYTEEEIAFKYYQFIDAANEFEFNAAMDAMEKLKLYDTGVTAQFGDELLTLSTCDYTEADGRFVVVAKKIK